ncbi:MAG: thioredoxin family protein, partial [Planctomycetota bacterium]
IYKQPRTLPEPSRGSRRPGGPPEWLVRFFLLAIVVSLGLAGWRAWGPTSNRWLDNPAQGFEAAAKSGKPVLVLHTSDRWPNCQKLGREVLMDPEIKAYLKREFVRVKVDLTKPFGPNNNLAADADVRDLPTMIIYSSRGTEIRRIVGADEVGAWIRMKARSKRPRLELK